MAPAHNGTTEMTSTFGNKIASSSPMEKFGMLNPAESLHAYQAHYLEKQKAKLNQSSIIGAERTLGFSPSSLRGIGEDFGSFSDLSAHGSSLYSRGNKFHVNVSYENGLFSSSLPDTAHRRFTLPSNNVSSGQSTNTMNPHFGLDQPFNSSEEKEIEAQTIGNLLPDDDDDLFSGVTNLINEFDYSRKNCNEDVEDDIFCSGGGMELEADEKLDHAKFSRLPDQVSNGHYGTSVFGEELHCDDPARTLFISNISSSIDDAELRLLFEEYGDIQTLSTASKARGFIMVSYYDIRSAQSAFRALQDRPLRQKNLNISLSMDNPLENNANQGTLILYNLSPSVTKDNIHQMFGAYGGIKKIWEAHDKNYIKFIEFYDVRDADAALIALNMTHVAGKQIMIEKCIPGRFTQKLLPKLDKEEITNSQLLGTRNSSLPGCFGLNSYQELKNTGFETRTTKVAQSMNQLPISRGLHSENTLHELSPSLHYLSSPVRTASAFSQPGMSEIGHSLGRMNLGFDSMRAFSPHLTPQYNNGLVNGVSVNSPNTMPSMAINFAKHAEGVDGNQIPRISSNGISNKLFDPNETAFGASGNGALHGHQYAWNSSPSQQYLQGPVVWSDSSSFLNSIPACSPSQMHGVPRVPSHMLNSVLPMHPHHVGSAPTVNTSFWDRQHVCTSNLIESAVFKPGSIGSTEFSGSPSVHTLDFASRNIFPHAGENYVESLVGSPQIGLPSPRQKFHGRNHMISVHTNGPNDRVRSRRNDMNSNQADNKKQYELDIERIMRGEDTRTTLMIKNIPNKYTSKMLLAAIDEQHRGTYDFIYLPIDFKNKCNVGYAFINIIDPQKIIPFYKAFNGKKWEKFNSEKVASLAYARIQGKAALIAHFQNSSLMNEDKRCRPILFHSDGPNAGDPEPFPMGTNIRSRPGRSRAYNNDDNQRASSSNSTDEEENSNGVESSSGSMKDME